MPCGSFCLNSVPIVVLNCFSFLHCMVCYLDGNWMLGNLIFRTEWVLLSVIVCMMSLHQSLIGSNSTSEGFQPPLVNSDAVCEHLFYFNQFCYGLKPEICDIFV